MRIKDVAQGMQWPMRIHPRLHAKPLSNSLRLHPMLLNAAVVPKAIIEVFWAPSHHVSQGDARCVQCGNIRNVAYVLAWVVPVTVCWGF